MPVPLTLATEVLLLVHAPPGDVSLSAVSVPWQKVVTPLIAEGSALMVTVVVATQFVTGIL